RRGRHRGRLPRRRPVHPAQARDVGGPVHAARRDAARAGVRAAARRAAPAGAGGGRGGALSRHHDQDRGAARDPVLPRRRRFGPAPGGGGHRGQRRRRGQGQAAARRGDRRIGGGHRARAPGEDDLRAAGGAGPVPVGSGGGGQRGDRGRGRRPGVGRGRRGQGGRGPGCDVHHPDDDGGGAAAVLRRAGVRRGGQAARRLGVGRRRGQAPQGRGAGAGRGRLERDDRVVVRRDLRVAGRYVPVAGGATVQGELRDGVGAGGPAAFGERLGVRAGAQGTVRGGHLVGPDVPGPGAARRGGPDRHDRGRPPVLVQLRGSARPGRVRRAGRDRTAERIRLQRGHARPYQLVMRGVWGETSPRRGGFRGVVPPG